MLLPVPNDPKGVKVTATLATTATIQWTPPSSADGFEISGTGFTTVNVPSGSSTSQGLTGLTPSQSYTLTVKTKKGSQKSAGGTNAKVTFTTRK